MKEAPGENFRQPREYAYTGLQHRTVRGSPLCPRASDVEFSGSICTNFPTVRESSPTVHGVSCGRFNLPVCPRANSAGSKIAVAEIEISLLSARRSLGENSHDTHHRVAGARGGTFTHYCPITLRFGELPRARGGIWPWTD